MKALREAVRTRLVMSNWIGADEFVDTCDDDEIAEVAATLLTPVADRAVES